MSKVCHFYATKDDLLSVTKGVESKLSIKYVHFGHVTKLPSVSFSSASEIPNLGVAIHESGGACEQFLVCDSQIDIKPRQLKTIANEDVERSDLNNKKFMRALVDLERFTVDQLYNPDTITFNPGGLWKEEILLQGNLGAAHDTEVSRQLMKCFKAAIKSKFTRVRACWVGPQALEMLKSGKRLTPAEQCPREYDLKVEI